MSDKTYAARERDLIEQFAVATLEDPKATPEDRRAARSRLVGADADYSRLSDDELTLFEWLEQQARTRPSSSTRGEVAVACIAIARKMAIEPEDSTRWSEGDCVNHYAPARAQVAARARKLANEIEAPAADSPPSAP